MARYYVHPDGTRIRVPSGTTPPSSSTSSEASSPADELLLTNLFPQEFVSASTTTSPRKPHRPKTSILHLSMGHGMPGAFQARYAAESIYGITERMENVDIDCDEDPLADVDNDPFQELLPPAERLLASSATQPERVLARSGTERFGAADVHVAAEAWDGTGDAGSLLWVLWWPAGRGVHVLRRGYGGPAGAGTQGLVTRIRCAEDITRAPGFHLLFRGRRLNSMRLATLDAEGRERLAELALRCSARERLVGDADAGTGELKTHQQWVEGVLFEAVEYGVCEGQDCWPALAQLNPGSAPNGHVLDWASYQY